MRTQTQDDAVTRAAALLLAITPPENQVPAASTSRFLWICHLSLEILLFLLASIVHDRSAGFPGVPETSDVFRFLSKESPPICQTVTVRLPRRVVGLDSDSRS